MEATSGFGPLNGGFADPCLATWLRRRKLWIALRIACTGVKVNAHKLKISLFRRKSSGYAEVPGVNYVMLAGY